MVLKPQILEKDGEKQFVILPYDQFIEVQEALDDLEDIRSLRAAKAAERDELTVPLAEVKRELGL
jgi:PHD/YefM family antitoxin component YafN of YafNO toxin-antitoxin module